MTKTLTITIPERVWEDFLDPLASGMQADLGLPEPRYVRRGKGGQRVYENVSSEVARELAHYLFGRGDTLLGERIDDPYDPLEKAQRDTYRAALTTSDRIRARLEES